MTASTAEARTEYLTHLRSLAEACRAPAADATAAPLQLIKPAQPADTAPLPAPDAGWTQLLDSILQLNARLDEIQQSFLSLELRICALEKNAPSPQAWRDLVQGIRSIRGLVAAQMNTGAAPPAGGPSK